MWPILCENAKEPAVLLCISFMGCVAAPLLSVQSCLQCERAYSRVPSCLKYAVTVIDMHRAFRDLLRQAGRGRMPPEQSWVPSCCADSSNVTAADDFYMEPALSP